MEAAEFIELIKNGDAEGVSAALSAGVAVDTVDIMDNPAVLVAAESGHKDVLKVLLDAGADPDARGWAGNTPIMVCLGLETLELLVAAGADPLAKNDDCEDALFMSAQSMASLEAMQEGIDSGHMDGQPGQYWPPSEEALAFHARLEELCKS